MILQSTSFFWFCFISCCIHASAICEYESFFLWATGAIRGGIEDTNPLDRKHFRWTIFQPLNVSELPTLSLLLAPGNGSTYLYNFLPLSGGSRVTGSG